MTTDSIEQSARQIPVTDRFEVAVVGGGVAGISAALAAARNGAKTVLIEKEYALGGLATLGLICIYLPLCNGTGQQVSFGIAEELLRLAVSCGSEHQLPETWMDPEKQHLRKNERYMVQYNPSVFAILAEQLLRAEGVQILYGTQLCDVHTENGAITALLVQGMEGLRAIGVRSVVDASGDAVVCRAAGENIETYHPKNDLAAWYSSVEAEKGHCLRMLGVVDMPEEKTAADQVLHKNGYDCQTAKDISRFVFDSHDAMLKDFLSKGPVSPGHSMAIIPTVPQMRMTWRMSGSFILEEHRDYKRWEDSVGMIGNWIERGYTYEIPFRALHGDTISNLLCAGRCISVNDAMWDQTRVIPACAVTGQAAGTAAAMGDALKKMNLPELQKRLTDAGVKLHPEN